MQHSQLRRLFDGAPPPTLSSHSSPSSSITSIPVVVVGHREEPSSGLEALKNKHVRDKGARPHRDSVDDLALLSLLTSSSTSASDTCGGAPSAAGAPGAGLGKENRRSSSVRTQRVSSAVHRDTTPHKRKSRGSAIRSPSVAPRQPLTPSTHHQHKPQPPQATESAAYETCDVEAKAKAKQQQPHTPPLAGERRVRRRPKKSPAVSNEDLRREIAGALRSHLGRDVSPAAAAAAATPKRKASSLAGVERNRLGYAHPPSSSSSSSSSSASSSSRGVGPLSASSGCVRLRNQRSLDGLLGQPLRLRAPCGPAEGEHGRQHRLRLQLHVPRLDVGRADHDNDDDGEWEACNEQPAKLNAQEGRPPPLLPHEGL